MSRVYERAEKLARQWETERRPAPYRPTALANARTRFLAALATEPGLTSGDITSLSAHVGPDPTALAALYAHPACPALAPGELAWVFNAHGQRWGVVEQAAVGKMVAAALARGASPTHGAENDLLCRAIGLGSASAVQALLAAGAPAARADGSLRHASEHLECVPLVLALRAARVDIAQDLLDAGAVLEDLVGSAMDQYPAVSRDWIRSQALARTLDARLDQPEVPSVAPARARM